MLQETAATTKCSKILLLAGGREDARERLKSALETFYGPLGQVLYGKDVEGVLM
jgi:hypothetical protein